MLRISKLWHRSKIEDLSQAEYVGETAPEAFEQVAAQEFADGIEEAEQLKMDAACESLADEYAQACGEAVCEADAEAEQDDVNETVFEADEATEGGGNEYAAETPKVMYGEQLRMPSVAVNSEPVVSFASASGEENINAERPVFNLLSSRIDRDDRLAAHPGFRDVRVALARWQNAVHYFESVTNPDLIDFAVYELEAAKRQYAFLLQLAKEDLRREGILASNGA